MAPSAITAVEEQYTSLNLKTVNSVSDYSDGEETCYDGVKTAKELIGAALQKRVKRVDPDTCEPGEEDTFFVADVGEVYRQHQRWKKNLKRVTPHYGEQRFGSMSLWYKTNRS